MARPAKKKDTDKPSLAEHLAKARAARTKSTREKHFRTKVANGVSMFLNGQVDERTLHARRFRELAHDMGSDLGGFSSLSAIQKQLIRRNAALCVLAEFIECDIVAGKEVDAQAFVTLANAQNRISTTLGITRQVLDVTPSLQTLLAQKVAERVQEAEEAEEPDGGDDGEA
jgi:hypothetical protein